MIPRTDIRGAEFELILGSFYPIHVVVGLQWAKEVICAKKQHDTQKKT